MQPEGPEDVPVMSHDNIPALYAWPPSSTQHEKPWVRCNMVMSLDGAIVDPSGKSAGLGTEADKRVFIATRRDSDVILVGAGTARDEGYRPTTVPIALVTNNLNLPAEMPLFADATPASPTTIVITHEQAANAAPQWLRESSEILVCGSERVDLPIAIAQLHQRGMDRIHCEGGPALLTSLFSLSLLDELLLTVSPVLLGGGSKMLTSAIGRIQGEYTQVRTDEGTVLMRFKPQYSA